MTVFFSRMSLVLSVQLCKLHFFGVATSQLSKAALIYSLESHKFVSIIQYWNFLHFYHFTLAWIKYSTRADTPNDSFMFLQEKEMERRNPKLFIHEFKRQQWHQHKFSIKISQEKNRRLVMLELLSLGVVLRLAETTHFLRTMMVYRSSHKWSVYQTDTHKSP